MYSPTTDEQHVEENEAQPLLFKEDFEVYADRGPNCINWDDPL